MFALILLGGKLGCETPSFFTVRLRGPQHLDFGDLIYEVSKLFREVRTGLRDFEWAHPIFFS